MIYLRFAVEKKRRERRDKTISNILFRNYKLLSNKDHNCAGGL